MAKRSEQLVILEKNLRKVKAITKGVCPVECKTTVQDLKVQSLILLSHAAIEEYLEITALDSAKKARDIFKNQGVITKALIGLISSGILEDKIEGRSKYKIGKDLCTNIDVFSEKAFNSFRNLIENNHGIRKSNQMNLLLPIGVNPEVVDSATMAALDSFGLKRGKVAHKLKIEKVHTLSEIDGDLKTILAGLQIYDDAANDAIRMRMRKKHSS